MSHAAGHGSSAPSKLRTAYADRGRTPEAENFRAGDGVAPLTLVRLRPRDPNFRILKPGKYMCVVFGSSNGRISGLVPRGIRDAGFKAAPSHVAILDKGERSVKGLNWGTEGVVTVDLILTAKARSKRERQGWPRPTGRRHAAFDY